MPTGPANLEGYGDSPPVSYSVTVDDPKVPSACSGTKRVQTPTAGKTWEPSARLLYAVYGTAGQLSLAGSLMRLREDRCSTPWAGNALRNQLPSVANNVRIFRME